MQTDLNAIELRELMFGLNLSIIEQKETDLAKHQIDLLQKITVSYEQAKIEAKNHFRTGDGYQNFLKNEERCMALHQKYIAAVEKREAVIKETMGILL
jgi:hypothetical protein